MLLIAFAVPMAIYFLILAHLNRGPRPVMVSGPWDFVGILFAASGFLLFGGPALLSALNLNETWRRFWILGQGTPGFTDDDRLFTVRMVLFTVYFVVVVAAAAFFLWRKRRVTAIYNVDPAALEAALDQVLERRQLPCAQTGNVLIFDPETALSRPLAQAVRGPGGEGLSVPPTVHRLDTPVSLTVDATPALCHVTLTWNPADSLLRRELEGQLAQMLEETPAPTNPVGDWMLILAYALFFFSLLGLTVLTLLWIFRY